MSTLIRARALPVPTIVAMCWWPMIGIRVVKVLHTAKEGIRHVSHARIAMQNFDPGCTQSRVQHSPTVWGAAQFYLLQTASVGAAGCTLTPPFAPV